MTTKYTDLRAFSDGAAHNLNHYLDAETARITPLKGVDGALASIDYLTAISIGAIPGHTVFRGFGERLACTAVTSGNDVWQGAAIKCPIPDQVNGEGMSLVSTNAADSAAGTGIRTVDVHYLDAAGNEQHESVTLNGITPAAMLATNVRFVQSIHANSTGTGEEAVGTISIYRTTDVTRVYNVIVPGGNMSLNSSRMVPAGKTFYLTNLSVMAADNSSVALRLRSTSTFENVLTPGFFLFKDTSVLQNASREKNLRSCLKFPALCIIKFTAYPTTNGASVAVNYDGWIE